MKYPIFDDHCWNLEMCLYIIEGKKKKKKVSTYLVLIESFFFLVVRSATVDAGLFSRYFGNCPVITAEGRSHPVSTYFLEDVYEDLKYSLASDSPVSLTYVTSSKEKVRLPFIHDLVGEWILKLSCWIWKFGNK